MIDIDLSLSIRQHGLQIYFQPAAIIARAGEPSDVRMMRHETLRDLDLSQSTLLFSHFSNRSLTLCSVQMDSQVQ
jgi:hypothetical protein